MQVEKLAHAKRHGRFAQRLPALDSVDVSVWQRLHLLLDNDVPWLMRRFGEKVGIQLKNFMGCRGHFFLEVTNLSLEQE